MGRSGGDAQRLTAGVGLEDYPVFSPDGKSIAFAGEYEGNLDVYVIPAAGGIPKRLTHHPDPDVPVCWTPDGKNIIFRSTRHSYARFIRLFSVPATGGQPTELPLPMGEEASLSPDGLRVAYTPFSNKPQFPGRMRPLKNYRGGTASPIWIADLRDSSILKVERKDEVTFNPMWIGDTIYYLSDRDGLTTIFACDVSGKGVRRILDPEKADIKSASACGDTIVFDRFGTLNLLDLKTGKVTPISIHVAADLPSVRPKFVKVHSAIQKADLSPTGARAVFESRGEIVTVPAEKGNARILTNTVESAERDPAWSSDGKSIAYFSDASGEYQLHVRPQNGRGDVKKFKLGDKNSFFYNPSWSPDSKKIAYSDKRGSLWIIDLASGKSTKVDTSPYDGGPTAPASWSPDSQWITFSRPLKSYMSGVFLYSLKSGKVHQITDGMSDSDNPVFDKSGKYVFFTASTDVGPAVGSGMSVLNRTVTRSAYVVVLNKDDQSPLCPKATTKKTRPTPKRTRPKRRKARIKKRTARRVPRSKSTSKTLINARWLCRCLPGITSVSGRARRACSSLSKPRQSSAAAMVRAAVRK